MRKFPAPIHNVVAALTRLPGVGPKTALRYAFTLLRLSPEERASVARSIVDLDSIRTCERCHTHAEEAVCTICRDDRRSDTILCVVAESRDISTIEATNMYSGRYFVLGGVLNPVDGWTPETLNVSSLMKRLDDEPQINEIILAFSPDVHGESTIMYLSRRMKPMNKKITRLARGLPLGADLEYTDEVTLGDALAGRRET